MKKRRFEEETLTSVFEIKTEVEFQDYYYLVLCE